MIVTDGGSNIKSAVRILNKPHIPCTAHKLNLVVKQALLADEDEVDGANYGESDDDQLKLLLQKCRAIVGFFKRSEIGSRKLREKQEQLGYSEVLKVKQDVKTRWNSTLLMIERLVKLKEPVTVVIMSLRDVPSNLTAEQWDVLEDFIPLLKPFESMTVELSSEKHPTLSKVIPLVRGVQLSLLNKRPTTNLGKILQSNLINNMRQRFESVEKQLPNPHFAIATILDPRYKKIVFTNAQNAIDAETTLGSEVRLLLQQERAASDEHTANVVEAENLQNDGKNLWGFLTSKINNLQSQTTNTSNAMHLVKQYIGMPYVPLNYNIKNFWQENKILNPLDEVAKKYVAIPATSVPAERIFSKAGQIKSARRNHLLPDNLDKLVFLNKNMIL